MQLAVTYADQILVFIMFAVSLNLLIGYTGVFSTAHVAFGAIGGYSVAYLTYHYEQGLLVGMLLGVVISVLLALLIGFPALRLDLAWVILLTLALLQVVVGVIGSLPYFGGAYGIAVTGVPFFGMDLVTATDALPLCIVAAAIIFALCWRLGESPYGRVLRAIREEETAVRALGKNIFAYKLVVMAITAAMASVAGSLLTVVYSVAQPNLFGFNATIAMIAMVIIGGRGSLVGTALAAALIILSTPFLQYVVNLEARVASLWQSLLYGAALVLVIYLRPKGIIPEGVIPRRRAQPGAKAATGPADAENPPLPDLHAPLPVSARQRHMAGEHSDSSPTMALEVLDASKSFGGIKAVDGLTLGLKPGAITALVGPNGAGKTTVFNLLTGALPLDRGTVRLWGEDITGLRPDQTARRGLVRSFQDVKLFPDLSVHENVALAVQGHPGEDLPGLFLRPRASALFEAETKEKALEWLRFVGMDSYADVTAASLGYGQQKLVAIARVLATDAEVMLLDEPASGIDHAWVDVTLALIKRLRAEGKTICIVEHNLHVVGQLADHVYFMELGKVTAEGELQALTSDKRLAEAYFGSL